MQKYRKLYIRKQNRHLTESMQKQTHLPKNGHDGKQAPTGKNTPSSYLQQSL